LLLGVAVSAVVVIAVVLVIMSFPTLPPSPLFAVSGKQQSMETIHGDYLQNGYDVINWNFTFAYNGESALQNVNLYLNNGNMPFRSVPEIAKGWTYEYIWTPGDISANATITISWQGGTEQYDFPP
jgi:hypothetical protein